MALQRASFAGIPFPIERVSISGGLRDHVHEYPHSPGGAPEKLGRKLYEIRMSALFFNSFRAYGPNLWPRDLKTLRTFFEVETTEDLVIPTIGTIQAYAVTWTQEYTSKGKNGERVDFLFREDQATAFLASALVAPSSSSLESNANELKLAAEELGFTDDLLDSITGLWDSIQAIGDQLQLAQDLVSAKLEGIISICADIDRTFPFRQSENFAAIRALHATWDSAQTLKNDTLRKGKPITLYRVPAPMTVSDISRAIYGDNSHAVDILRMNPIEDAFRVPANTVLSVYAAA
jgi:hypothetical protein